MEIEEILDAFCRSRNLKRKQGTSLIPLHPFLIMDCVLTIYTKWIAELEGLRFEARKYKNAWSRIYLSMNRTFFKAFNTEQKDVVIGLMDDLEHYISNDLVIAKMAIMDYLETLEKEKTLEQQQVASSCILGEVLCYAAKTTWEKVFKQTGQMDVYKQIDGVCKSIHKFVNVWYKPTVHIDVTQDKKSMDAISVLCQKIVRFLDVEAERRKQSKSDNDEG